MLSRLTVTAEPTSAKPIGWETVASSAIPSTGQEISSAATTVRGASGRPLAQALRSLTL
jgi:hypothetical protein